MSPTPNAAIGNAKAIASRTENGICSEIETKQKMSSLRYIVNGSETCRKI
jgi:hypothetical protein